MPHNDRFREVSRAMIGCVAMLAIRIGWMEAPSDRDQLRGCSFLAAEKSTLLCDDEVVDRLLACGEGVAKFGGKVSCRGDGASEALLVDDALVQLLQVPVDINTSGTRELQTLPFVGRKRAAAIIEARPFSTIDGLQRVHGIGPKTVERLRARVVLAEGERLCWAARAGAPICGRCDELAN